MAALAVVCAGLRAVGPVMLGNRRLPRPAEAIIAVLAPALLAGLVVVEVAGQDWDGLDPNLAAGVLAAGVARLVWAPPLVAVAIGAAVAATLRLAGL